MANQYEFSDIDEVPTCAGLYEVFTNRGTALKVGIAKNLRNRLKAHAASRQSALKVKKGRNRRTPSGVVSKSSVLAKHLYYDSSISNEFDLKTEKGRRRFLRERCFIVLRRMGISDAKTKEKEWETKYLYRYVGKVVIQ